VLGLYLNLSKSAGNHRLWVLEFDNPSRHCHHCSVRLCPDGLPLSFLFPSMMWMGMDWIPLVAHETMTELLNHHHSAGTVIAVCHFPNPWELVLLA
jgi:hypothetical protein